MKKHMTTTSATLVSYYHLCHRKLWLHANEIRMEHTSAAVAEGKQIEESTYQRRAKKWREVNLGHSKIDHFDPKQRLVREVKKSPKLEHSHVAQVQYYLYALEQRGISGATGIIEYPKQRKTTKVELTSEIRKDIQLWEVEIKRIVTQSNCPELVKKSYCKTCAFYEFCYI
jgi:CRISPR-associated exonuclease Cas4